VAHRITEHRTLEGKVYCAVVLDAFSRRVVGWSIDSSQTSNLVVNALAMASEAVNRSHAGISSLTAAVSTTNMAGYHTTSSHTEPEGRTP